MTPYVVHHELVRYLILAALYEGEDGEFKWTDYSNTCHALTAENAGHVGQMLVDFSVNSVARWLTANRRRQGMALPRPGSDADRVYTHEPGPEGFIPEPVQVLVSLGGYVSQCVHHPDWETSNARAFALTLREATWERVLRSLAGYRTARRGPEDYPRISPGGRPGG